jgi:hypothetical protein
LKPFSKFTLRASALEQNKQQQVPNQFSTMSRHPAHGICINSLQLQHNVTSLAVLHWYVSFEKECCDSND